MMPRWLLLCLCAFCAAWIVAAAASNFGVRGFAYGWYDVDTFSTTQPYVVRFDSPQPDGAAVPAGIRAGDLLDLREQPTDTRWWLAFQPVAGHQLTFRIHRGASPLSIAIVPSSVWDGDWRLKLLTVLAETFSSVWFLGCATILVLRRAAVREARVLALILLSMALSNNYFTVPNPQAAGAICMFSQIVCEDIAWVLLLVLASGFGVQSPFRRIFETAVCGLIGLEVVGLGAFSFGLQTLKIDPMVFGQNNLALGVSWTTAIDSSVAVAMVAAVIWAVAATPSSERTRASWLLLPVPIALLAFTVLNTFGLDLVHFWSATQAAILLGSVCTTAGALAVTYALLRRRVLDLGFFLSRTIVVATISLIIVAAFVLLEWMLGNVVAGVSHTTGIVANAVLALVLGLSLHFIHQRVDAAVDSIFFRKRHEDERSLRDYAKEATFITDVPVLLDQTIGRLERHTDARGAAIFVNGAGVFSAARSYGSVDCVPIDENDEAILALKAWHRPLDPHHYRSAMHGALALPMLARGRLLGLLLLDERAGGESYAPDEVDALSTLAQGVASSLDALAAKDPASNALLALADAINALREDIALRLPNAASAEGL